MRRASASSPVWVVIALAFVFGASKAIAEDDLNPKSVSDVRRPAFKSIKEAEIGDGSNNILQFETNGHIVGFKEDRVCMVGMGYALIGEFVGAKKTTPVVEKAGEKPQAGKGAPPLERVMYEDLWEGVTLKYEARQAGIAEAIYIVQPQADPSRIRVKYNAEAEIQPDGSLRFKHPTEKGYFTMTPPAAWQEIGGDKVKVDVESSSMKTTPSGSNSAVTTIPIQSQ